MASLAASVLLDDSDSTRLTSKEVTEEWGSSEGFMRSYQLKPLNFKDCLEALVLSRGLKHTRVIITHYESYFEVPRPRFYENMPTIGKWIKWNMRYGRDLREELKGKVLSYEYDEDYPFMDFRPVYEKLVNVKLVWGEFQRFGEDELNSGNWSYCEVPTEDEIEREQYQELNSELGGRVCNSCNSSANKLDTCSGCNKVYYCDTCCQRNDWSKHKAECKLEEIVLKPNPRYPLPQVIEQLKIDQIRTQEKNHQLLQQALDGNFTVDELCGDDDDGDDNIDSSSEEEENSFPYQNPKAGLDLEAFTEYKLRINKEEYVFKWIGVDPPFHSIPSGNTTSCSLFREYMGNLEFVNDNVHHLVGSLPENGQEFFWNMLINFNTYDTVAHFYGPCECNRNNDKGEMRPKWREARKKWNKILKRAKEDINDVQCMFSDTEEGCHNCCNVSYVLPRSRRWSRTPRAPPPMWPVDSLRTGGY